MKLLFFGPQGSGKGTQAVVISQKLNIPHISVGDLLRGTTGVLKIELDSYMNQGKLVPDELTIKILKERLLNNDCKKGFILDGFPRNLNQLEMLKNITAIDKAIEITLTDDESIKRISGRVTCEKCKAGYNELTSPKPQEPGVCDVCEGKLIRRSDDNPEAVKKRLHTYHQDTEPILNSFKEKLIKINGIQPIEKITQEILEKLKKK
ncbi:MAG: nucleoside monophosphate kinase [Candidatus Pacearchaeota archaeon]|jgi:adenylate kinase